MASNEILSSLAKVKISEEWIIAQSIHYLNQQTFIQDNEYNAYERDVAVVNIFFGKTSVLGLPVSLTCSQKN